MGCLKTKTSVLSISIALIALLSSCNDEVKTVFSPKSVIDNDNITLYYQSYQKVDNVCLCTFSFIVKTNILNSLSSVTFNESADQITDNTIVYYVSKSITINNQSVDCSKKTIDYPLSIGNYSLIIESEALNTQSSMTGKVIFNCFAFSYIIL